MISIQTMDDFFDIMRQSQRIRKDLTQMYLDNKSINPPLINPLRRILQMLANIPQINDQFQLRLEQKDIPVDLSYEIQELKKDIFFLEHNEDEFNEVLKDLHPKMIEEMGPIVTALQDLHFNAFIADRDGTINNYCARYITSIQSIYNAVFLTRFAKARATHNIILTSAPLDNIGLVDLCVAPDDAFNYAGSKGREFFTKGGSRFVFPINKDKQGKLNELNNFLSALVQEPDYKKFTLIGSGLQFKFGQTTLARQDINYSIPADESEQLLALIQESVPKLDPENKYFRIEDTGKDIEIILTIDQAKDANPRDFDKGDGVKFLDKSLKLNIKKGISLICGDTKSDIPMVQASMDMSKDTWVIFVTKDERLKETIRGICSKSFFVSEPDTLVAVLNTLGLIAN